MDVKEMSLKQITERLAELDEEVRAATEVEAIERASTEKQELLDRKAELDALEERKQTALNIAAGKVEVKKVEERKENKPMNFSYDSPEYRVAWLNKMRGAPLSDVEERAFTGSAYVVPDNTANMIIDKLVDMVPLLNEIELVRIKGNVSIAVQSAAPSPKLAAGGSGVDEATTTLVEVSLGYYTLSTLVRIGADIASMAIDAFERWLTGKIAEQLSYKLEYYIIKGSGSGQPKGINYAFVSSAWADGTDAVDWASTALSVADIDEAISMLPAAYDKGCKFLMSKKTFYQNVIGLDDQDNIHLIDRDGKNFLLRGYPVLFSDQVDSGDIFFGDFKRGMVGNLSNEIQIERDRNLPYNAWDYLGWCSFDCKPSGVPCIIKIASDI